MAVIKIKLYYIIDEDGNYFSTLSIEHFAYWSKNEDKGSIENRIKYIKIFALFQMFIMRIRNHQLHPRLELVKDK